VVLPDGSVLIDDANNFRIRRVALDGTISTVVGTGVRAFSGDGGPAVKAQISSPRGIAGTGDGGYLIADSDNNRVRRVWADGTITTVAGNGSAGASGDGGPATAAALRAPYGVSALPDGTFVIADQGNHEIRKVTPDGKISTIAGTGVAGYSGDGGPATAAKLSMPHAVEAEADGSVLIVDTGNHRIRRVAPDGTISTLAGTGTGGFSTDGDAPASTQLFYPKAVVTFAGGLLVADSDNYRVRFIGPSSWPTPAAGTGPVLIDAGSTYTKKAMVNVGVRADGATSVRLSDSPDLTAGVLTAGKTFAYSTPIGWDITDTAYGGTSSDGVHRVYAQWQAPDGSWSPVAVDSIVLDTVAPVNSALSGPPSLSVGSTFNAPVPTRVSWSTTEATSHIERYDIQLAIDGAAPKTAANTRGGGATDAAAYLDQSLNPGSSYSYQISATDSAGNTGPWSPSTTIKFDLLQDNDATITYTGLWSTDTPAGASGGTVKYTTDPTGTATITFTGRSITWITPVSPTDGLAKLTLDTAGPQAIDLSAATPNTRRVVYTKQWATTGTHTLKIAEDGTGSRIDLDALLIGS
jgi:hypothetical protein